MSDDIVKINFKPLLNFLKEHPGLGITLTYLLIMLFGIIYSLFYYSHFGIDIFYFVELSDFILIVIKEPVAIVSFVLGVVWIVIVSAVDIWTQKTSPKYRRIMYSDTRWKNNIILSLSYGISLLVITFIPLQATSSSKAEEVKSFTENLWILNTPGHDNDEVSLIGSSSQFLFVLHRDMQVEVVPNENINSLKRFEYTTETTDPDIQEPDKAN